MLASRPITTPRAGSGSIPKPAVSATGSEHRLDAPNIVRVLANAAIAGERPHAERVDDRFAGPLFRILEQRVDALLSFQVAAEIRQHQKVLAVAHQSIADHLGVE